MRTNNISFKASFNVSDALKNKYIYRKSPLNRVYESLSKDFAITTNEYPHYTLEAAGIDIHEKELQFKLKVGEKVEATGFYNFLTDKKKLNNTNLIKIFKDLRSKAVYNKSLKYLQEWYYKKLIPLKNDTPSKLDNLNAEYAKSLKAITEQREKEQKLYKLEE